jgi:hypothetical protein
LNAPGQRLRVVAVHAAVRVYLCRQPPRVRKNARADRGGPRLSGAARKQAGARHRTRGREAGQAAASDARTMGKTTTSNRDRSAAAAGSGPHRNSSMPSTTTLELDSPGCCRPTTATTGLGTTGTGPPSVTVTHCTQRPPTLLHSTSRLATPGTAGATGRASARAHPTGTHPTGTPQAGH